MTPYLDIVEKLIHIFGIPGIIGAIIWLVRVYDGGKRELKEIHDGQAAAIQAVAEVKAGVDLMESNHMSHMQTSLERLEGVGTEHNRLLTEIASGIKVLVDRGTRL